MFWGLVWSRQLGTAVSIAMSSTKASEEESARELAEWLGYEKRGPLVFSKEANRVRLLLLKSLASLMYTSTYPTSMSKRHDALRPDPYKNWPAELLDAFDAGEGQGVVAFVGSGPSCDAGLPNWADLLERVAKDVGLYEKVKPHIRSGKVNRRCSVPF